MNASQDSQQEASAAVALSPATRQRVQKVFEHAQRCVEKNDRDYANKLFSQCVAEDPASLIYLQIFLENLKQIFGEPKKASKLAGLRLKSYRSSISKAASSGSWQAAFTAGCQALSICPWDTVTLLALAEACRELGVQECRLYYLRWALLLDLQDATVNRQAAMALEDLGQFDQAIACWQRVCKAEPENEEAARSVARLSVEKTIQKGGYDSTQLTSQSDDSDAPSVAVLSTSGETDTHETQQARLEAALQANPAEAIGLHRSG